MGKRGPQKRPSAMNELMGNPGKRAINNAEPQPPQGTINCPEWVSANAKAIWAELAPPAEDMGVLTTADVASFALMCNCIAEYIKAYQDVQENGYEHEVGQNGTMQIRPAVSYMNSMLTQAVKLLDRFGLNPSNRVRIELPGQGGRKPVEDDSSKVPLMRSMD